MKDQIKAFENISNYNFCVGLLEQLYTIKRNIGNKWDGTPVFYLFEESENTFHPHQLIASSIHHVSVNLNTYKSHIETGKEKLDQLITKVETKRDYFYSEYERYHSE